MAEQLSRAIPMSSRQQRVGDSTTALRVALVAISMLTTSNLAVGQSVPVTVDCNWISNLTSSQGIWPNGTGPYPQAIRLDGAFSGFAEGEIALPSCGSWEVNFSTLTDEQASGFPAGIPGESMRIFLNGELVADHVNAPPDTLVPVIATVIGDSIHYRFEMASPVSTPTLHMLGLNGTATGNLDVALQLEADSNDFAVGPSYPSQAQTFFIDAGSSYANFPYLQLSTLVGAPPGPLTGPGGLYTELLLGLISLNSSALLDLTLTHPGYLVQGALGVLDECGRASTQFVIPAGLIISLPTKIEHAVIFFSLTEALPFTFVPTLGSNVVETNLNPGA